VLHRLIWDFKKNQGMYSSGMQARAPRRNEVGGPPTLSFTWGAMDAASLQDGYPA
jgi:hypothetical protein